MAKFHRANKRQEVCAKRSYGRAIVRTRIYRHDKEDRRAGKRRRYGLCNSYSVNLPEIF